MRAVTEMTARSGAARAHRFAIRAAAARGASCRAARSRRAAHCGTLPERQSCGRCADQALSALWITPSGSAASMSFPDWL